MVNKLYIFYKISYDIVDTELVCKKIMTKWWNNLCLLINLYLQDN